MPDYKNNRGASYGYRIIVLVDFINNRAILLSIYHKINKKDLDTKEKNMLKTLNENYEESL